MSGRTKRQGALFEHSLPGRPRTSTHTAKTYQAKYLSGTPNASHARLLRLARMIKRESGGHDG